MMALDTAWTTNDAGFTSVFSFTFQLMCIKLVWNANKFCARNTPALFLHLFSHLSFFAHTCHWPWPPCHGSGDPIRFNRSFHVFRAWVKRSDFFLWCRRLINNPSGFYLLGYLECIYATIICVHVTLMKPKERVNSKLSTRTQCSE